MPNLPMYRCSVCGRAFRPMEAGRQNWKCCDRPLERVKPASLPFWRQFEPASSEPPKIPREQVSPSAGAPSRREESPSHARPTATAAGVDNRSAPSTPNTHSVIEVIPPREHRVDEAGAERLFASLGSSRLVSVEIGAESGRIKFLLWGSEQAVSLAQHQVQAAYDQARFRPVPPDADPARRDGTPRATAKLHLRKPCYLPLLTFGKDDFETADPLRGLLGIFSHLEEGERLLSQLILTPAPRGWADAYSGYLRPSTLNSPGEPLTIRVVGRQAASVVSWVFMVASLLHALMMFLQHQWIALFLDSPFVVVSCAAVGFFLKMTLDEQSLNPELVQKKIQAVAYDVNLRLTAFAPTSERARELLHELADAYRQFDLASGNGLEGRWTDFDPRVLERERTSWWNEFRGRANRLNVAELAAMWHLPLDRDVPLIERTQAKRLLPLPATVEEGVLIGYSDHQGHRVPVHLSKAALWGNCFMVAKTQAGKSTLMGHLASAVMEEKEGRGLVVIDPHGDLVRSLLPLVPRERVSDVVFVDFSEPERVLGLNLLDMKQGRSADKIASGIVHVGQLVWSEFWGPRMESALRFAVRTLLAANAELVKLGERQFTILDIPPLFQLENFRNRVINQYVKDKSVLQFWDAYFNPLRPDFQMEVVNPVMTKIHRFAEHSTVRQVVGQSSSTVNFKELLEQRKLLFVNTATGVIGPDAGALLGALIIDIVNFCVRDQMKLKEEQRARVAVIIDEFQSILGVDYPGLLGELQKMGASFILATQALGVLKAADPKLQPSIFSNVASLFAFQTSAEDADFLAHELDERVTATDVINLSDYTCYLKTKKDHEKLPAMYLETLPPAIGSPECADLIVRGMPSYTYPAILSEQDRDRFQTQWYGRELELLRKLASRQGRDRRLDPGLANPSSQAPDARDEPRSQRAKLTPSGDPSRQGLGTNSPGEAGEENADAPAAKHKREDTKPPAQDEDPSEETRGRGSLENQEEEGGDGDKANP